MAEANLSVDVYERLSERILKWDYPPGHRLTEEELCAEFAVSRSPIREALGKLAERGLVDKKARQGYSVRRMDLREIEELYDVRAILEAAVADRLCAGSGAAGGAGGSGGAGVDAARLDALEKRWRTLRDGLPELAPNSAEADEEFHRSLAEMCGNGVLRRLLGDIDRRIHFIRLNDITNPERLLITCRDHLDILEAIRRRDAAAAKAALKRNIEWGKTNVEAAIKDALVRAHSAL
jgi:DNA-binding GntR family transcriptional regulator